MDPANKKPLIYFEKVCVLMKGKQHFAKLSCNQCIFEDSSQFAR